MTIPTLLPCPFCGSSDVSYHAETLYSFVVCDKCEAEGPAISCDETGVMEQAAAAWNQRSAWQHPREGTEIADNEFNALCDAHGFSAVARGELPLVPRNLLKALVDAAVLAERERSAVVDSVNPGTIAP